MAKMQRWGYLRQPPSGEFTKHWTHLSPSQHQQDPQPTHTPVAIRPRPCYMEHQERRLVMVTATQRLATAFAAVAQAAELAAARPRDANVTRVFRLVLAKLEAELRAAHPAAVRA